MSQQTTKFIADLSVTTAKIANDAVTATQLATVNSNVGSFGSATQVTSLTVNAKGLVTAASNSTIAIPFSQVSGTVPLNQGGTGQTTKAAAFDALSPMTTGGDLIYGGASGTGTRLANGSAGQVLTSNGGTAAPSWQASTATFVAPTVQKFTSGSGTYTLPTSPRAPLYIRVRMIGGGGGGGGGGQASGGTGGTGGNTTFGTSLLTANGGSGSTFAGAGGAGGSASLGTGPIGTATTGSEGQGASRGSNSAGAPAGGQGAATPFGGGGPGAQQANNPNNAIANTGAGGGGGSCQYGATTNYSGGGGGAGGFVDAIIASPSSTYSYAVGAAGTAGTAGTNGFAGGAGGSGYIEVTEYYQ